MVWRHGFGECLNYVFLGALYVYYAAVPACCFYTRKAPIPCIVVNRSLAPRSADPHQLARAAKARKLRVVVSHDNNKNRLALIKAREGRGKGVHVDRFPGAWRYSVVQDRRRTMAAPYRRLLPPPGPGGGADAEADPGVQSLRPEGRRR